MQRKKESKPEFDLIMAVDNCTEFHHENMKRNGKEHYTVFSRFTHGKVVKMVHDYGAKIHFNDVKVPKDRYLELLEEKLLPEEIDDDHDNVHFRYGIVHINDLVRDLKYWETLMVSSMMQRPISTIIECDPQYELETH